jgi:hypothetical protein
MSEEAENENAGGIIKQSIDSVTALTKAVPIYEDAVQPLAKETGKALGTIGKAVNVALAPISLVVWGYDQMQNFLETRVAEKLEKVPEDRIITPPPNVAGPAIEALKFAGNDETLQDMFANLIANSLDSKTVLEAHPAFVDIIKSLSPDEGLILKVFASTQKFPMVDVKLKHKKDNGYQILHRNLSKIGAIANCKHQTLTPIYLDNLCRLGILEIPSGRKINDQKVYEAVTNEPSILQLKKQFDGNEAHSIDFEQKVITVTGIGLQFINACIIDKRTRG